ncbi:MAG: hypothetical protein KDN19_18125 [Verrucomicrobiae bacterium]|nr:hypothetical protein [Verrucomicrobiae bacterium]
MKNASPAESDSATETPGGLLFAWSSRKAVVAHLGLFLAISAGIHFFGFYLFQVVYPVTARVEPVPSRVRLLDPAQPAVSALMRQIDDRVVFLRPASTGTDARIGLADHSVQFQPSFAEGRLGILRVPLSESIADDANDLDVVLPPVERIEIPETTLSSWRIGGALVSRQVRRPDFLEGALAPFADLITPGGPAVRLNLATDRQGNVVSVQIADPANRSDPRFEKLETTVLSHLRFEPEAGPAPAGADQTLQRGWLDVGR